MIAEKQILSIVAASMWFLPQLALPSTTLEPNIEPTKFNAEPDYPAQIEELRDLLELAAETAEEANAKVDNATEVNAYIDFEFINKDDGTPGTFRMHHTSLFFKKQINEKWKFFSELEFEDVPKFEDKGKGEASKDGDTTQGKIFLEAVNFDYEWDSKVIIRGGRFFTPAGIWSENHYPPYVPTQDRPAHIRKIFPQLVDGLMVHGTVPITSGTFLKYNVYTGNGEAGDHDEPGKRDDNGTKILGIKTSFLLPFLDHLEIGATYYTDGEDRKLSGADKTAVGLHILAKIGNTTILSEGAQASIVPVVVGAEDYNITGYFLQAMYDYHSWTFGGRIDFFDKDDSGANDKGTNSLFVNYHIDSNLVVKLEHHQIDEQGKNAVGKSIFSVVYYID